jgi:peptidoglycan/LPS O-acetylase OafA/YrhL
MRNANLDALRGLAILMVLGNHIGYFGLWQRTGWAGVDLFFVLSGFLISGLLFDEWHRCGSIDFRRFYIRRGFKIYPPFYVMLLITVALNFARPGIPSFPVTWHSILAEATFTQNYFRGIWGQTWSLGVEEHFYILLPILLWLMYRGRRSDPDPFRWMPATFMIVATVEIALRVLTTRNLTSASAADLAAYQFPTHLRIDALLFGVLIRYYRQFQPAKFAEMAQSKTGIGIIGFAVLMLAVIPGATPVMHTIGFSVVFFGCGFLLARTVDAQPNHYVAALVVRPLAKIGYYSYSIYLWHGFACRLLPHGTLPGVLLCVGAAVLVGVAMAKLIEYPMLTLRDRVLPSGSHTAGAREQLAVVA